MSKSPTEMANCPFVFTLVAPLYVTATKVKLKSKILNTYFFPGGKANIGGGRASYDHTISWLRHYLMASVDPIVRVEFRNVNSIHPSNPSRHLMETHLIQSFQCSSVLTVNIPPVRYCQLMAAIPRVSIT
jgi:hypothetical protein